MIDYEMIWTQLEAQSSAGGETWRRVAPERAADIFLVLDGVHNRRTLRIELDDEIELGDHAETQGVGVTLRQANQKFVLEISLLQAADKSLFSVLVGDLINFASRGSNQQEVARLVASRVAHWQGFMKSRREGLTAERVRGLFAELKTFEWIWREVGHGMAIEAWVGPSGAPQDFNLGSVAIETKASKTKNPQAVKISSERQLDSTGLKSILLWHYSFDERADNGETLPSLVAKLRGEVSVLQLSNEFEERLFLAGYSDSDAHRYEQGFTIRRESIYHVGDDFPRLTESDCAPGLGDVQYSIQLGAIEPYVVDMKKVLEICING